MARRLMEINYRVLQVKVFKLSSLWSWAEREFREALKI